MPPNNLTHLHFIIGIILALIYISLLIIEHRKPLRKPVRSFTPRLVVNLSFTLLVYFSASLFIAPVAQTTINLSQIHGFGVLFFVRSNGVLNFVLGFLLMDLTFYYWHRLNHEIPLLWRFHNVHHTDPDLDVTTSMRFHFIEIAYSSIFRLLQLALIGINPILFICYEFIFQASTFFQHSNLRLPIHFERILNIIMVTPRMHGIHHSNYMDETNRNYGVIFSFWDRLHKTMKLNVPQQSITIGVPGYLEQTDNKISHLLLMPFKVQRKYWQINNKKYYSRHSSLNTENTEHLAE